MAASDLLQRPGKSLKKSGEWEEQAAADTSARTNSTPASRSQIVTLR